MAQNLAPRDFRYAAFISYSHSDEEPVEWMHRAIESYRIPAALAEEAQRKSLFGYHVGKVFRDRDELSSQADLSAALEGALAVSAALILVCSPAAARSPYVNEEIRAFKALGRSERIFALIVGGEPHAVGKKIDGRELTADDECFPPALLKRVDADGQLSEELEDFEHIAADMRPGKDDRHSAKLKLIAGLLGVGLDDLVQRERVAARRRMRLVIGAMGMFASVAAMAAYFAYDASRKGDDLQVALIDVSKQRDEAKRQRGVAQQQEQRAREQQLLAEEQTRIAERETARAEQQTLVAQQQRVIADQRTVEAVRARDRATQAQLAERLAREQETLARQEAVKQRDLALTREAQAYAAIAVDEAEQGSGTQAAATALQGIELLGVEGAPPETERALIAALAAPVDSFTYAHEQAPMTGVHFSHDGRWLVSTANDGDARLVSLSGGSSADRLSRNIPAYLPELTGALFTSRGDTTRVTVFTDSTSLFRGEPRTTAFAPRDTQGRLLRPSGADMNTAKVTGAKILAEGEASALLQAADGGLFTYQKSAGDTAALSAILPTTTRLLAADPDRQLFIRQPSGDAPAELAGYNGTVNSLQESLSVAALDTNSDALALISSGLQLSGRIIRGDNSVPLDMTDALFRIMGFETQRPLEMRALTFGAQGRRLVGLSEAGDVIIWDARNGSLLDYFARPEDVTGALVGLTPDGRWAYTDRTLWRTTRKLGLSQKVDKPLDTGIGPVAVGACAEQSNDAFVDADAFVRLDGNLMVRVDGRSGTIVDCTGPSPDVMIEHGPSRVTGVFGGIQGVLFMSGNRIATTSYDQTYRIWSADDGAQLFERLLDEPVGDFTLTQDGTFLARQVSVAQDLARNQRLLYPPEIAGLVALARQPLPDDVSGAKPMPALKRPARTRSSLPSAREIDAYFENVGAEPIIQARALDRLDRDLLYGRATTMEPEAFRERYDWLPPELAERISADLYNSGS